MRICWDNLDGIWLNSKGDLRTKSLVYIEKESCKVCGNPFLTNKYRSSEVCSKSCKETDKREDLTDRKFNRLYVKGFAYIKKGESYWECICDCGEELTIRGAALKDSNTKSCGCLQKEMATERIKSFCKTGEESSHYKHGLTGTKEYWCAAANKYRAKKLNQTPDNANLQKIQLYYTICAYLNKPCEIPMWHVDHIKPISKGGLHHEDNLQILTAAINLQKGSKYPLTDEEQVLYKGVTI